MELKYRHIIRLELFIILIDECQEIIPDITKRQAQTDYVIVFEIGSNCCYNISVTLFLNQMIKFVRN